MVSVAHQMYIDKVAKLSLSEQNSVLIFPSDLNFDIKVLRYAHLSWEAEGITWRLAALNQFL